MSNQIKLLVGLANPGLEYKRTRHNAGAWVVEELARMHNVSLREEAKFFGLTGRIQSNGQDLRLLIPTTFMNLSGKAIASLAKFYQIKPEEILVAHDELDLPPGVAKFKKGGGHGGHNGLRDTITKLANTMPAEEIEQRARAEESLSNAEAKPIETQAQVVAANNPSNPKPPTPPQEVVVDSDPETEKSITISHGDHEHTLPIESADSYSHDKALSELKAWKKYAKKDTKRAFTPTYLLGDIADTINAAIASGDNTDAAFDTAFEQLKTSQKSIQSVRIDFEDSVDLETGNNGLTIKLGHSPESVTLDFRQSIEDQIGRLSFVNPESTLHKPVGKHVPSYDKF
mgnify:CR=1 FL=1